MFKVNCRLFFNVHAVKQSFPVQQNIRRYMEQSHFLKPTTALW